MVLVFSWIMVFLTGSAGSIGTISAKTCLFLVLSGVATGASWLFYFRALQLGDVNKVAPIDKSSTIPVSYTHLDVYKRQVLGLTLLLSLFVAYIFNKKDLF